MMPSKPFLPVICGPTASGKSELAIRLALACGGEVISADSMQIYRDLLIGTARVAEEEARGVPHHMTGFLPLSDPYSVARYVEQAHEAIRGVLDRGHMPILCGGTGLYISSLIGNLQFTEQPDTTDVRAALRAEYERIGGEAMLGRLREVDPALAARLHPNDAGRIIRALEVWTVTGHTMSEQIRLSRLVEPPYDAYVVMLDAEDRALLYDRIDKRVDSMIENGLEDEARMLFETAEAPTARQAIGYKEWFAYFRGECSRGEVVETLKRETRRYAKRQLSWFRRIADETVLIDKDGAVDAVLEHLLEKGRERNI